MSHITIIISKTVHQTEEMIARDATSKTSYEYYLPVPHGASPAEVAALVRSAYRRLEGPFDS
jgi:hypothetical protein